MRITYKKLHAEVVRVFGGDSDEPIAWVKGPNDLVLSIMPGPADFEMRFRAFPDRASAKAKAFETLRRMNDHAP